MILFHGGANGEDRIEKREKKTGEGAVKVVGRRGEIATRYNN